MENERDIYDWIREIQASDQPEVDKLKTFFDRVTGRIVDYAGKEIELYLPDDFEQYIRLYFTVGGSNATAGKVTAFVTSRQ